MRVHHIALRTRDVARLESFYAGVLGLRATRRDEARGSVWLDAGGAIVMIEHAEGGEPAIAAGSMELVAFAIDAGEMGRWKRELAARGIAVEGETAYTLYFRDPDGRRVGLSSY
jgi:catechol 2,3-dioxygenase-like lactoylglutathione lyase family enzyme